VKIAIISKQAFSLRNFRGPMMAEIISRGHEVIAFAPDFNETNRADLMAMGVQPVDYHISQSGLNPLKELLGIFKLLILLRSHKPDISFVYFLKPLVIGTIAAWLAGVPHRFGLVEGLGYAFTTHSGTEVRRRIAKRLVINGLRLATARLHKIIFLNSEDLGDFLRLGLATSSQTEMLGPIGVDLSEWSVAPLPQTPVTFIFVARLLRDKGIGEFVAAARILRSENPELRFIVLGDIDGNPSAITRSEMDAWVDEGVIEWPGHVDVKPWLAKAHVFVLPSYYREGVPRSTQEAMAMGRAVITTDAPGCRETVDEGINGFLVPVRDPQAVASVMRRFVERPETVAIMGAASRQIAVERFSVQAQNEKLLGYMDL
jgi:glycosyltransferase involved in cell wall biosynthesis